MSDSLAALRELAVANCCQEPIRTPGTIQSFGALIVADLALETITHVSANLAQMLGLLPSDPLPGPDRPIAIEDADNESDNDDGQTWSWDGAGVLGRSLDTILSDELIRELADVCNLPWIDTQRERMGAREINGRSFDVCAHLGGDRVLIELEPLLPAAERSQTLVARVKALLQGERDYQAVLSLCAEELRQATGFDRIMVYRFLPDDAGEVIAEARADDEIPSYLNLRFPATDIPELVREILRKFALRAIPNINAPLVPLLAWDETEAPLDLSLAFVRGASLGHTQEYLPNMGVACSMTLAIAIEGKLWGIFACHHRQPKLLSPDLRASVELCGLLVSLYLQQKLTEEDVTHQRYAAKLLTQMFGQQVRTDNDWKTLTIQSSNRLCDLMLANGVVFASERQILSTYGNVPGTPALLLLIEEAEARSGGDVLTVDSLSQLDWSQEIAAQDWGPSAGMLFLPIDFNGSHHLAFFRNETIGEVRWAGNPDAPHLIQGKDLTGAQLRPQRSFEAYKQLVAGHCRSWSRQDLSLARELREALETQIFLQERQSILIAELKHRVKNILALIRSVARQTRRSSQSIDGYVRVLEQRISALSMAHDLVTRRELLWPRLQDLLDVELRPYLNRDIAPSPVTLTGPEVTLNSSFVPTFILVLHELVSNAVKYGALSVPDGWLAIRWFKDRDGLTLLWREAHGPDVRPPESTYRGFGCELIERAIPYEFDGEANLCFAPSGVEATFWIPQKLVKWEEESLFRSPQAASSEVEHPFSASSQTLTETACGDILLVEDNMLIAIEMENFLRKFGFSAIDSAPTVDRAMKLLRQRENPYRACLLDINLKTETSFAIADYLRQVKIPFAFISGYDAKYPIPDTLKNIPLLKKPIDFSKLAKTLQVLLGEA